MQKASPETGRKKFVHVRTVNHRGDVMCNADGDRRILKMYFPDRRYLDRRIFDRRLLSAQVRDGNIVEDRRADDSDRRARHRRSGVERRV